MKKKTKRKIIKKIKKFFIIILLIILVLIGTFFIDRKTFTKQDFLNTVYMTEERLNVLMQLLESKLNIILEGAPGVGKTFSARKLAYTIMGEEDDSRIEMVQFHQNYSYEDFIMGYKPEEDGGFILQKGIFYKFCRMAKSAPVCFCATCIPPSALFKGNRTFILLL